MTAKRMPFAHENLAPAGDPGRGPAQVRREVSAMANNVNHDPDRRRAKVISAVECIHRSLPKVKNYQGAFRSTKNLSRSNMGLWVLEGIDVTPTEYVDLDVTWPRPLHPSAGPHEARSIMIKHVAGWQVVVAHAPQGPGRFPKATNDAINNAREEWLDAMVKIAQTKEPLLILTDPNGLGDDLRRRAPKLNLGGLPADAVLTNQVLTEVHTPAVLNGVTSLSDHHTYLIGTAELRGKAA